MLVEPESLSSQSTVSHNVGSGEVKSIFGGVQRPRSRVADRERLRSVVAILLVPSDFGRSALLTSFKVRTYPCWENSPHYRETISPLGVVAATEDFVIVIEGRQ